MELTKRLGKTLLGAGLAIALGFAMADGNPAAAQGVCVAPPSGMISWWDADSVSGTTATDIQDGNNGTMQNGVGVVSGKVGNAFSFNGTTFQHIQLPFDSGDVFTNQFTVDAWAFPTKLYTSANGGNILVNDDQSTGAGRGMFLALVGGSPASNPFLIQGTFHNTSGGQFNVMANTTTGAWHHYALTYDGSKLCLYQDGVLASHCVTASGNVNDNNRNFEIAGTPNFVTSARFYGGLIDEVEIFDRALTAAEVLAIYNAGSAGKCKPKIINIKPGSDPNSINVCSAGSTPVTIWGSANLDVSKINPEQLVLATESVKTVGKSGKILCSIEDVGSFDGTVFDDLGTMDGFDDLTCHFVTVGLNLTDASTTAELMITGCDDPSVSGNASLCEAGDPGFFEVTAEDAVNIVKDECS